MRSAFKPGYKASITDWAQIPSGVILQQAVAQQCNEAMRMCFGYHLLKIGDLSCQIDVPGCTIQHAIQLGTESRNGASVVALPTELPFVENSIDAILLAHQLDFAADPHQILREIERVITSDGYLVVTGFNPFSLDGVINTMPSKKHKPLRLARYFRQGRVADWLHLLGFEIVEQRKIAHFSLMFNRQRKPNVKAERFFRRFLSWFGSSYIIVARKREMPLSKIPSGWKLKPKFSTLGASARISAK